uniref:Ovule protein n=1 Tax=Heterorhabditis bacteriophora TaxID=37862 RepID=A0A1I7WH04_HETBA
MMHDLQLPPPIITSKTHRQLTLSNRAIQQDFSVALQSKTSDTSQILFGYLSRSLSLSTSMPVFNPTSGSLK